jgi:hypothetical protein
MTAKDIVLVEPGVHLTQGHYREKLMLWLEGFQRAGWNVSVACLQAPEPEFLPGVNFKPVLRRVKRQPNRFLILWLVFRTYWLAFQLARRSDQSVLGLTTSTLLPVGAAYLISNGRKLFFGQVVMNGNTLDKSNNAFRRYLEGKILNFLLRSGVLLFPNTEQTRQSILRRVNNQTHTRQILTLNDPIRVPVVQTPSKPFDNVLLVPGPDDYRKAPLLHLLQSKLANPPRSVWIHAPGGIGSDIVDQIAQTCTVRVLDRYESPESFAGLFASATWCLVAYRPTFLQGSGLLAQAVVGDTPVLSSHFPYAEELFQKYGRLGELFDFGDMSDFARAWDKLRNWTLQQWQEFHEASARFRADVNATRVVQTVVNLFSGSNATG